MEIVTGEMNYNEDLCRLLTPAPVEGKHCLLFFNLKPDLRPRPSMSFAISNLGNSGFRRRGGFPRPEIHKLVFQPGRFPFCELFQIAEGLASPHSKYLYVPTSKESRITVSNLKFAPTIWLNIFYFIYSDELETMLIKNQKAMTEPF